MIAYGTYITRFRLQAVKIRCQHPASLRWVFVPLLFLLLATDLHAQLISDTLNIRFRRDSVIIDMDFDGNRQRWEAFEREYRERLKKYAEPLRLKHQIHIEIYRSMKQPCAAMKNAASAGKRC